MAGKRERSRRKTGGRRYRRKYTLICEGAVTERVYFEWIGNQYRKALIKIDLPKRQAGKSAPPELIKRADRIRNTEFKKGDELWIVLDKDEWTEEQYNSLNQWRMKYQRNFLAVSSPKFEYWLLLHKSDPGSLSPQEVDYRYQRWMGSGKGVNLNKLSKEKVLDAARRARQKHESSGEMIPRGCGSTVYQLIENIEEFVN